MEIGWGIHRDGINLNLMPMEPNAISLNRWDDIVFENRNRDYGAYTLRRRYADRVMLGTGVSIALVALVVLLPSLLQSSQTETVPVVREIGGLVLVQPPKIERPKPQTSAKGAVPEVKKKKSTSVRVVQEPVEEVPPNHEELVDNVVSADGETGGADGLGDIHIDMPATLPEVEEEKPLILAEVMPEFEGGQEGLMRFIKKKIRYPASARKEKEQGTVFVQFVVTGDGRIADVKVIRGFHPDCDREAMRVISMITRQQRGAAKRKAGSRTNGFADQVYTGRL